MHAHGRMCGRVLVRSKQSITLSVHSRSHCRCANNGDNIYTLCVYVCVYINRSCPDSFSLCFLSWPKYSSKSVLHHTSEKHSMDVGSECVCVCHLKFFFALSIILLFNLFFFLLSLFGLVLFFSFWFSCVVAFFLFKAHFLCLDKRRSAMSLTSMATF